MGVFTRAAAAAAMVLVLHAAPARAALSVDAPPRLQPVAERLRTLDLAPLDAALRRAGLVRPDDVRITLIADDDPRARSVPGWIVGLAFGERDIVIFPGRVLTYPYDSLESVVRHEMTHLALNAAARGQELPRWFHEGVATSVDAGRGIGAGPMTFEFNEPGQWAFFAAGTRHEISNTGDGRLELIEVEVRQK